MKYLLKRNLYKSYGIFAAWENCRGIRVHKDKLSFNLTDEVHSWLEEQGIEYSLEIEIIDEKTYSDSENNTLRIMKHKIGSKLYIDIDMESLILFKLTWG